MITIQNLAKAYGARTLFEGVTLKLVAGSRYGLVGANGSGKTTFLEVVSGDEPASDGTVTFPKEARLGVLRQDRFMNDEHLILDVAMAGDEIVMKALGRAEDLHRSDARIVELEDRIAAYDGYTLEARASAILEGLGIPSPRTAAPRDAVGRLQAARAARAGPRRAVRTRCCSTSPPTTSTSSASAGSRSSCSAYRGCAVVISHDQRFLDNVATHILDVDYGTITLYPGNYSRVPRARRSRSASARRPRSPAPRRRSPRRRPGSSGSAPRRPRRARRRAASSRSRRSRSRSSSRRRAARRSSRSSRSERAASDVLEVEARVEGVRRKPVLVDVSLTVRRGERVAVIGPNGLGKSTLLKIATGNLDADAGTVKWGHETHVGYFAQDHHESLVDPEKTPIDFIWDALPTAETAYVRGQLGRVLFSGDDVKKKVGTLSGGEAARLVFCRIMVERPNVLVLDEPTNHLDLEAIEALVAALREFEDGTLVFVSHDRAFVSALATRILEVTPQGFRDFPGTYDEYLARCGDDHLDAEAVVLRAKGDKKAESKKAERAPDWEEQKKRANRLKALPTRRDEVVRAIEIAEARKAEIHARWCEPGFYEKTPPAEIAAIEEEEKSLDPKIEALMAEWEALESELASAVK
jgi:ATPase subunit of ABC transporter with duplicated ATPase domains